MMIVLELTMIVLGWTMFVLELTMMVLRSPDLDPSTQSTQEP
jgi:hypothetical protein